MFGTLKTYNIDPSSQGGDNSREGTRKAGEEELLNSYLSYGDELICMIVILTLSLMLHDFTGGHGRGKTSQTLEHTKN